MLRTYWIALFTLFGCFAANAGDGYKDSVFNYTEAAGAHDSGLVSKTPLKLTGFAVAEQFLNTGAKTVSGAAFKIPFAGLSASMGAIENILLRAFSQYVLYSHNFLSLFRGVDIIFPFHYFW